MLVGLCYLTCLGGREPDNEGLPGEGVHVSSLGVRVLVR